MRFQVRALEQAFLNEVRIAYCIGQARRDRDRAFSGKRLAEQAGQRAARIGDHCAGLALDLRVRVVDRDIDPVEREARGPACADHAAADNPDLADRVCRVPLAPSAWSA